MVKLVGGSSDVNA